MEFLKIIVDYFVSVKYTIDIETITKEVKMYNIKEETDKCFELAKKCKCAKDRRKLIMRALELREEQKKTLINI